jgi:hypothetical protein
MILQNYLNKNIFTTFLLPPYQIRSKKTGSAINAPGGCVTWKACILLSLSALSFSFFSFSFCSAFSLLSRSSISSRLSNLGQEQQ